LASEDGIGESGKQAKEDALVKVQLENITLQMYRDGTVYSEAVREFQKVFVLTALKEQKGNQCKAAAKLGIHRNTLRRTIRDLQLDIRPLRATARRRTPRGAHPVGLAQRAS